MVGGCGGAMTTAREEVLAMDFMECSSCSAKSGTPTLCASCFHNRALVSKLQGELREHPLTDSERRILTLQRDELRAKLDLLRAQMTIIVEGSIWRTS